MYEDVLLPTDGSPAMGSIIEQGLYQAGASEATLHALYVVDVRAYVMLPDETAEHVAQLLQEAGEAAVEAVRARADEAGVAFEGAVTVGVPHEAILGYADDHDIDLVVMGTHGQSGDRKRIVGSVAEEVIRSADVPVLVVPMSEVEREAVSEEIAEEQRRYVQ